MKNKSTREKIKKMMEGMLYHCTDMSELMSETIGDPYFDTEEGKKIRRCILGILSNHVMALSTFITSKESDDLKKETGFDIEDFLKDCFK